MFRIYWTSEDEQGGFCMGQFDTRAEAEAALPAAQAELLKDAFDDADGDATGLMTKQAIAAGTWSIDETE